jgi:LPXTG-motif cell wall-anchored protein
MSRKFFAAATILTAWAVVLLVALLAALFLAGPAHAHHKADHAGGTQSSNENDGSSSSPSGSGAQKGGAKKKGGSSGSGPSESSANTPAPAGSQQGKPAQGCDQAEAGYTHNYASTCDGSPSENGEGGGKATGKPCAGCVGAADNKNPKGQFPDGSDANNGYECDGNKGIGKGNPAHTGCLPAPVVAPEGCPEGTVMVDGACVPAPPDVRGDEVTPSPDENEDEVEVVTFLGLPREPAPAVLGQLAAPAGRALPVTGSDLAAYLLGGLVLIVVGAFLIRFRRHFS